MRKKSFKEYIKNGLMLSLCMVVLLTFDVSAKPLVTADVPGGTVDVTTAELTPASDVTTEKETASERVTTTENEMTTETTEVPVETPRLKTPKNVKVSEQEGLKAKLTWKKVSKATGYVIYRSLKKTKGYKKVGTATKTTFVDTKIKSGNVYYYKVAAVKKNKAELTSEKSEPVSLYIKPISPLVQSKYVKKSIKLTWKKVSGAKTYYVYKKNSKGKYKKIAETEKLYYTDKKVKEGTRYSYKVKAGYKKDGKTVIGNFSAVCKALALPLDPTKKMIALTFDDGPGRYTNELLDCLERNNAKATFFVVGCNVGSYKDVVKRADRMGCEIGNHSYSHAYMNKLTDAEIKGEIAKTDETIKKITGEVPALIRTPGGIIPASVNQTINKPIILWSIDTRDWETRNKTKTMEAVLNHVRDGDIVLMHDIYEPTKEAACALIVELQSRGYQLVTVSELAQYREISFEKSRVYHSLRKK